MKNKKIDWEERRWLTASLILAGMHGNYHREALDLSFLAKFAVKAADSLIKTLAETNGSAECSKHYQREDA